MNKDYILGIFLTFAFESLWGQPTITPFLPTGDGARIDVISFDAKSGHTTGAQPYLVAKGDMDSDSIRDIILHIDLNKVSEQKNISSTANELTD